MEVMAGAVLSEVAASAVDSAGSEAVWAAVSAVVEQAAAGRQEI